ncbi:MAG TPA: NAD(P)H-binding protein, partial [Dongiaceae bacterium]|nr:NAD(P)H-binding protein [Dongiaceae bacterium]
MKIVLFGATGMVGRGALLECLRDPSVDSVLSVVRRPSAEAHCKLREIVQQDFLDFSAIENEFRGADACIWALGVTSVGSSEGDYTRITHDFALAAAHSLLRASPRLRFVFVSGRGADAQGSAM